MIGNAPKFRYLADPVCIASLIVYTLNRFALKPHHIGGWFTHGYLNDVLCLPLFVPIILYIEHLFGLRPHLRYPRAWEIIQNWAAFTFVFQVVIPRYPKTFIAAGDPWDILAYAAGGIVAGWWWSKAEHGFHVRTGDRMRTATRIGVGGMLAIAILGYQTAAETPTTSAISNGSGPDLVSDAASSFVLTPVQAQTLEDQIKANPDDAEARARLLGYLLFRQKDPQFIPNRRDHILWMIQNRPADPFTTPPFCEIFPKLDPDGYLAAKALWKQQTDKPSASPAVLSNAAAFMSDEDPAVAVTLLERAEAAEPDNSDWPQHLAELYRQIASNAKPADKINPSRLALAEYERCLALSKNETDRLGKLTPLPSAAFAAGDKVKAADYANRLLSQGRKFAAYGIDGDAIYSANVALGRIALASGDIATAKIRLLDAARTHGSPVLDSYGPNMELARELLEKGEKDVVLQYFDLCAKFWGSGRAKLDSWRQTINSGGIPDFGENLIYGFP